jgi:hypothetical protein
MDLTDMLVSFDNVGYIYEYVVQDVVQMSAVWQ